MQLQVGNTYRTRNGHYVKIISEDNRRTTYPFVSERGMTFTSEGELLLDNTCVGDLVRCVSNAFDSTEELDGIYNDAPSDEDDEDEDTTLPPCGSPTAQALSEVYLERERQEEKWGQQNHDSFGWLPILMEEVGEVARAINEASLASKSKAYRESQWENYREELIQVAAVAVAMVESFDRNYKGLEEADEEAS